MTDKHPNAPRGHLIGTGWPSVRFAQDGSGDKGTFNSEAEVPEGWEDTPPQPKVTAPVRPPARGVVKPTSAPKVLKADPWPKPAGE